MIDLHGNPAAQKHETRRCIVWGSSDTPRLQILLNDTQSEPFTRWSWSLRWMLANTFKRLGPHDISSRVGSRGQFGSSNASLSSSVASSWIIVVIFVLSVSAYKYRFARNRRGRAGCCFIKGGRRTPERTGVIETKKEGRK